MRGLSFVFTAFFLVLCGFWYFPVAEAEVAEAPSAPQAMPVTVETVKQETVQIWKDFSGRVHAVDYVEIRPQVSGTITEILFEAGARVNKGDILFTIDKRPYEATLKIVQANLQTAENQLVLADKEMERAKELIKTNAISKRNYDERISAWQVAASQVDGAKASLEQAQINLDYASVKAPISGYTSRAEVTLGNLVDANAPPILTSIVSDVGVYADFEMDESTYLKQMRGEGGAGFNTENIAVEIVIPSLADQVFKGKIHSFDNRIDPASGTIRVRAYLPNESKMLVPGMFVNVRVGSPSTDKVIMLTEKAISTDQDRKFVLVADNGKAAYRPVTLGAASGGKREILSGLADGDQVIVEGIMMIRPDMPVAPMTAEEKAKMMAAPPAEAAGGGQEQPAAEAH